MRGNIKRITNKNIYGIFTADKKIREYIRINCGKNRTILKGR
jgi:hypothetical protein